MRQTKQYVIRDVQTDRPALEEAAAVLRQGGLVVFPTETVYGIGANALDGAAIAGIFAAKGRPQDNPLIVHVTSMEEVADLVTDIPEQAHQLAQRFWPGPLTIILPKSDRIPEAVSAGLDTVAIRMPSHPVARALIRLAGVPVAAPSANLSGSPSPTTAAHCVADLDGRVDSILDGGPCEVGLESTVITLVSPVPRVLRPGAVTVEQLREVLGAVEVDDAVYHKMDGTAPAASPGMKYKHYAPKAEITLVHGDLAAFQAYLLSRTQPGLYALVFDGEQDRMPDGVHCVAYGGADDPAAQGERLFAALRELDGAGAQQVYARVPDSNGIGLAVYNRLVRAAAFREVY